jgi:hypothetical protein
MSCAIGTLRHPYPDILRSRSKIRVMDQLAVPIVRGVVAITKRDDSVDKERTKSVARRMQLFRRDRSK